MRVIWMAGEVITAVDDDDFERLYQHTWHFDGKYVQRQVCRKTIYMHREIMHTPPGLQTDHINGNKLDNHKSNLRICTKSQNACNVGIRCNNKSGFKGVSFNKRNSIWVTFITKNQKSINLGSYPTPEACAHVYDAAAKELFGEFAKLNFSE